MANTLVGLWELDQYHHSELLRKKVRGDDDGFIIRQSPDDAFFPKAAPRAGQLQPDRVLHHRQFRRISGEQFQRCR